MAERRPVSMLAVLTSASNQELLCLSRAECLGYQQRCALLADEKKAREVIAEKEGGDRSLLYLFEADTHCSAQGLERLRLGPHKIWRRHWGSRDESKNDRTGLSLPQISSIAADTFSVNAAVVEKAVYRIRHPCHRLPSLNGAAADLSAPPSAVSAHQSVAVAAPGPEEKQVRDMLNWQLENRRDLLLLERLERRRLEKEFGIVIKLEQQYRQHLRQVACQFSLARTAALDWGAYQSYSVDI